MKGIQHREFVVEVNNLLGFSLKLFVVLRCPPVFYVPVFILNFS
jgi:hypothetical protein